ncbi:hypothetical protein ABW19_dt0206124 [Dactylella cylindrospora]|nr:hypothetical protein ABW19_dt0206124 [Dactylella cylindrospora]
MSYAGIAVGAAVLLIFLISVYCSYRRKKSPPLPVANTHREFTQNIQVEITNPSSREPKEPQKPPEAPAPRFLDPNQRPRSGNQPTSDAGWSTWTFASNYGKSKNREDVEAQPILNIEVTSNPSLRPVSTMPMQSSNDRDRRKGRKRGGVEAQPAMNIEVTSNPNLRPVSVLPMAQYMVPPKGQNQRPQQGPMPKVRELVVAAVPERPPMPKFEVPGKVLYEHDAEEAKGRGDYRSNQNQRPTGNRVEEGTRGQKLRVHTHQRNESSSANPNPNSRPPRNRYEEPEPQTASTFTAASSPTGSYDSYESDSDDDRDSYRDTYISDDASTILHRNSSITSQSATDAYNPQRPYPKRVDSRPSTSRSQPHSNAGSDSWSYTPSHSSHNIMVNNVSSGKRLAPVNVDRYATPPPPPPPPKDWEVVPLRLGAPGRVPGVTSAAAAAVAVYDNGENFQAKPRQKKTTYATNGGSVTVNHSRSASQGQAAKQGGGGGLPSNPRPRREREREREQARERQMRELLNEYDNVRRF